MIIVVSFVPLFFLTGMEGRMLVPLGIAFIVALFASTDALNADILQTLTQRIPQ